MWCGSSAAETCTRRRASPLGTTGNAKPTTSTTEFQQTLPFADRLGFVADHDRDDGGRRIGALEAELRQTVANLPDVVVQAGDHGGL